MFFNVSPFCTYATSYYTSVTCLGHTLKLWCVAACCWCLLFSQLDVMDRGSRIFRSVWCCLLTFLNPSLWGVSGDLNISVGFICRCRCIRKISFFLFPSSCDAGTSAVVVCLLGRCRENRQFFRFFFFREETRTPAISTESSGLDLLGHKFIWCWSSLKYGSLT